MNEYRPKSFSLKAYKTYIALKLHFTTLDYDYFKYQGKLEHISKKTFDQKNDRYYFSKLIKHPNPIWLVIANLSRKPDIHISDILSEEGESLYLKQQKILQSFTYFFEQEVKKISNEDLILDKHQFPLLFNKVNRDEISLETAIIFTDHLKLLPIWNDYYKNNILWFPNYLKFIKYRPFITYKKEKILDIMKNRCYELIN